LTKISCGATGQEEHVIAPEESDIFVSPDGFVSPYPSSENNVSLYDAIKTRNTQEVANLLQQAIDQVDSSRIPQKKF